jgi:hypothetical protein
VSKTPGVNAFPSTRYSADPTDVVGYANFQRARAKHGCAPTVFVDGKPVDHVVTADEQLGLVLRLTRPLHVEGEQPATVEMYGRVEVHWSPPWRGSLQHEP